MRRECDISMHACEGDREASDVSREFQRLDKVIMYYCNIMQNKHSIYSFTLYWYILFFKLKLPIIPLHILPLRQEKNILPHYNEIIISSICAIYSVKTIYVQHINN